MDFKQTQQAYGRLKDQFGQGHITAKEFEDRVNEMVVTDSTGILWQMGVKTGKWYRYDGQNWVEDLPPGLSPLSPAGTPPERISRSGASVNKRRVKAPERISRRQAPERISQPLNRSNYHPPTQQLRKQTSKVPWVIGSVVSACACAVIVSIVLFTMLSHRPKILGQMTVTQDGGSFQNEAVTIQVPVNAVSTPIELEITQLTVVPEPSEGVFEQSSQIGISGPLQNINGRLKVTMPIPDKWLTPDGRLLENETLVYILDEQTYTTSEGVLRDTRPLPTEFDLQTRTMTTELILGGTKSVSQISRQRAGVLNKPVSSDVQVQVYLKAQKTKAQQGAYTCNQGWFRIYHSGLLDETNYKKLCEIFNEQKKNLEEVVSENTFQYRKYFPIDVYLKKSNSYWGLGGMKETEGLAVISNINGGVQGTYINLNIDMINLNTPDDLQKAKALIGHELFHIVQYFYNPILMNSIFPAGLLTNNDIRIKTLFSDEAMSVWFEPEAVGDLSFVPKRAKDNIYPFFSTPMIIPAPIKGNLNATPPVYSEEEKGYGGSLFLVYLTNKYGTELVWEILQYQSKQNADSVSGLMAWESVLKDHGASLSSEYVNFTEEFLIPPPPKQQEYFNNIHGRLGYMSGIDEVNLVIKLDESQADLKDDKLYAVFEGGSVRQSVKGYHKTGAESASARIQVSMQNTTIRLIRLKPYSSFPSIYSGAENSYPGTLMVKLGCLKGAYSNPCPDSIGLLAYPVSTNDNQPSAGAALSSAQAYLKPEGFVSWPSTNFASGNPYHDLFLILFNKYLNSGIEPATVFIDLYYTWDKQLEVPIPPTEEPIPPTEEPIPPTEQSLIPLQPDEMSPEQICECENRYMNEVQFPNSEQYYKDEYGSDFVSLELVDVIPYTYNPSSNMCEGHYAYLLCTDSEGNPNYCYFVWNHSPYVGYLDQAPLGDGLYHCSLLP